MAVPPQNLVVLKPFYGSHWTVQDSRVCNVGHVIPCVAWHSEQSSPKPEPDYAIQSGFYSPDNPDNTP